MYIKNATSSILDILDAQKGELPSPEKENDTNSGPNTYPTGFLEQYFIEMEYEIRNYLRTI